MGIITLDFTRDEVISLLDKWGYGLYDLNKLMLDYKLCTEPLYCGGDGVEEVVWKKGEEKNLISILGPALDNIENLDFIDIKTLKYRLTRYIPDYFLIPESFIERMVYERQFLL